MAKLLFATWRREADAGHWAEPSSYHLLANAMGLDANRAPLLQAGENWHACVFAPGPGTQLQETGALIGPPFKSPSKFFHVGGQTPTGSFGLVRLNDEFVEIPVAPITNYPIWYYHDTDRFAASTSQLLLIGLLGSWQPNQENANWVLRTLLPAPYTSWDRRIKLMTPDAVFRLNRNSWQSSISTKPFTLTPKQQTKVQAKAELAERLAVVFQEVDWGKANWLVPLSGGVDSRTSLMLAHRYAKQNLKALTYGYAHYSGNKYGNQAVAKRVSNAANIPQDFVIEQPNFGDPEGRIRRFVRASDGRGFTALEHLEGPDFLKRNSILGDCWLRSDEVYGWAKMVDKADVETICHFDLLRKSALPEEIQPLLGGIGIPQQLQQNRGESLEDWRDRLYHTFRIPTHITFYVDLECNFFDVFNPHLHSPVVDWTRTQLASFRTDKSLFKDFAWDLGPKVPYAVFDDQFNYKALGGLPELDSLIAEWVPKAVEWWGFDQKAVEWILNNRIRFNIEDIFPKVNPRKQLLRSKLKRVLPRQLTSIIKGKLPPNRLSANQLAYALLVLAVFYDEVESLSSKFKPN